MIHSADKHGGTTPPDAPSETEIREQLERIRSSPEFDVPDRAKSFFSYVVEEAIAGRVSQLKAYSIALQVFGREASFDAQSDPAVRIEACRIRRALERYYLVAGQSDPLVITIPKGGYAPIFTPVEPPAPPPGSEQAPVEPIHRVEGDHERPRRLRLWLTTAGVALTAVVLIFLGRTTLQTTQQSPTSAWEEQTESVNSPRILVEPFEDLSATADSKMIALGLTDEVIAQLSKFKEITVIGADPSDRDNNAFVHRYGAPRYVLEGRVRTDGTRLRLTARFLNRSDGSVIWANSYDRTLRVQELLDVQSDVATGVVTALAQPYGIIFQTDSTKLAQSPPDDWDAYACTRLLQL